MTARPGEIIVDQIVRLEAFRAAHPAVLIEFIRPIGLAPYWEATWPAPDDGSTTITQLDLKRLLDRLDREFP